MVNRKIYIAVSSCLLGEAVRYDGTDKKIDYITTHIASEYNLISLCPEMAIGMGVPRPPIHLVDDGGGIIQLQGIDDASNNVTDAIIHYADDIVKNNNICGYIFKKNSPSCGTKHVKVLNVHGQYERKGQGLYAATIMAALPLLPVIDEEDCLNKKMRDDFLDKVIQYSEKLYLL